VSEGGRRERSSSGPPSLLAFVGATGTGKTALATAVAERVGGEIVSCDSAQIYRGLDVGTASPSPEERARAPHHLVDILDPREQWSAAEFADAADAAISGIRGRGKVPILVGGNGLWYRALVRGIFRAPAIDPELRATVRRALQERGPEALHLELARVDPRAAARIQPRDPQRIGRALEVYRQTGTPISALQAAHGFRDRRYAVRALALDWDREALRAHLGERVQTMFAGGILQETRACLESGCPPDAPGLRTIGYREAVRHLVHGEPLEAAVRAAITATRRYAKRQRNWFRHEEEVVWIPPTTGLEGVLEQLRPALGGV
jgi:tRNA dimethylallyltransferase